MREKLVVVGNGMAAMRSIEEILSRDRSRYQITILSEEPHLPYNRIQLSSVLSGEKATDDIITHPESWLQENQISIHTDQRVTTIDRSSKIVETTKGDRHAYDRLILATGSTPIIPPLPGRDFKGVLGFRDLHDVSYMIECARNLREAVVIGGGLLGLEAASGLAEQGMDVKVIHLHSYLMENQLDQPTGRMLQRELERRGIKVILGGRTVEHVGDPRSGQVMGVRLEDGSLVEGGIVVWAIGIRPRVDLAQASGLVCERGIVVDDFMTTSDPSISAVGECVEHRGKTYGLVAPLYEMAKALADHLTKRPDECRPYFGSAVQARLKVSGIDLFSAGNHRGDDLTEDIIMSDERSGVYRKLVLEGDTVVGMVLYGDTADASWYFKLMVDRTDVSQYRSKLLLGRAYAEGRTVDQADDVLAWPDDTEICGCNGVSKGTICAAISAKGLCSIDDVRAHTKASASCGSCTPQVAALLAATLGADAVVQKEGMCPCTPFSHEDVREAIVAKRLMTIPDVMKAMDWKTPDGCHRCRPALNYYLICAYPGVYRDQIQSRLLNERIHANVQKDGTYSVVPRMWGGVTSSQDLRTIADVSDRYKIPTVKVTGGQRIDLLGVRKEDLPHVWRDLTEAGMVSGHAYGKAVRTVKTCVGSEWCRFGVQDSTGLGIAIEKMSWGAWTPHKVKMAVSGCPRNCAEATIKDFGVVAVDSGWELHIGGNAGSKGRFTDLLCKVSTAEEVLEYCGAFLQLYREQGRYLERTAQWMERVGLDYVKGRLVNDVGNRKRLYALFLESQESSQVDPWGQLLAEGGPSLGVRLKHEPSLPEEVVDVCLSEEGSTGGDAEI